MSKREYRRVRLYGSELWAAAAAATGTSEGGSLAVIGSRAEVGEWIMQNRFPHRRPRCPRCRRKFTAGSYAPGGVCHICVRGMPA